MLHLYVKVEQTGSSTLSPFFPATLPLELTLEGGETVTHRVFQTEAVQQFDIPLTGTVTGLAFDPENWILKQVTSVRQGSVLGIKPHLRPQAKLYPQPASQGYAYLEGVEQPMHWELVDLTGRSFPVELHAEGERYRIRWSQLPRGMYQLHIQDAQGSFALPLMVP